MWNTKPYRQVLHNRSLRRYWAMDCQRFAFWGDHIGKEPLIALNKRGGSEGAKIP
jgi:hypothetical protein